MATLTFYEANTDGTIGSAISSGQLGKIIPQITISDRTIGATKRGKVWVLCDADIELHLGISEKSSFGASSIFVSALDADAIGDLTGTERVYSCYPVVSVVDGNNFTIATPSKEVFVVGNIININELEYEIGAVSSGGGTTTITTVETLDLAIIAGTVIVSTVQIDILTGVAKSFWREEIITSGAAFVSETATAKIFRGYR